MNERTNRVEWKIAYVENESNESKTLQTRDALSRSMDRERYALIIFDRTLGSSDEDAELAERLAKIVRFQGASDVRRVLKYVEDLEALIDVAKLFSRDEKTPRTLEARLNETRVVASRRRTTWVALVCETPCPLDKQSLIDFGQAILDELLFLCGPLDANGHQPVVEAAAKLRRLRNREMLLREDDRDRSDELELISAERQNLEANPPTSTVEEFKRRAMRIDSLGRDDRWFRTVFCTGRVERIQIVLVPLLLLTKFLR